MSNPTCRLCGREIPPEKRITIEGKQDICYDCYKQQAPMVCVDFDGVLAQYDGWKGPDHLGDPIPGIRIFLSGLKEMGFCITILTTRKTQKVNHWILTHRLADYIDHVTNKKPPAKAYIDDRGICFKGDFSEVIARLKGFKPWWEK